MLKDFQGSSNQLCQNSALQMRVRATCHFPEPNSLTCLWLPACWQILLNVLSKMGRRKFLNSRCLKVSKQQALLSESQGHRGEQSVGFHQLSSAANKGSITLPSFPTGSKEHLSWIKAERHLSPSQSTPLKTAEFSKCWTTTAPTEIAEGCSKT